MNRLLELGKQEPYQQEPENAWVFRVLRLSPAQDAGLELRWTDHGLCIGNPGASIESCAVLDHLHPHVTKAVKSWMQYGQLPDDHTRAALIVMCNQDRSAFLLQRKDEKHPNKICRGRYSLFGGSPHVGEPIADAAVRELLEEIRSPLIEDVLHTLTEVGALRLASVQWDGSYDAHVFRLELPNETFAAMIESIAVRNQVSEAIGVMFTRQEFDRILFPQEEQKPGTHFLASLHQAIAHAIRP